MDPKRKLKHPVISILIGLVFFGIAIYFYLEGVPFRY